MHLLLYIGDSLSTFERISYIIGGVALFLYGIHIMGEALKSLAGNKLKMIIEKTTSTTLKGIITGALMTALIQSSSGTTAIVVALISAGLMSLPQAVSVIMGANIGTTITSIIIGLNISDYSLIIIGVGALMCFFSSRQKITDTGVAILGFGLLFLITKITKLITKRDCFGEGDAYILGALGAFFGIVNTIIILILSIFIWGGLSIPIFLYKWVKNGEYKLFATVLLFMISAILFFLGTIFDIFTNQTFLWFTYLLVASLGLRSCWLILNSIKQGNQLTVIPFGPALVFGAFVVMFLL